MAKTRRLLRHLGLPPPQQHSDPTQSPATSPSSADLAAEQQRSQLEQQISALEQRVILGIPADDLDGGDAEARFSRDQQLAITEHELQHAAVVSDLEAELRTANQSAEEERRRAASLECEVTAAREWQIELEGQLERMAEGLQLQEADVLLLSAERAVSPAQAIEQQLETDLLVEQLSVQRSEAEAMQTDAEITVAALKAQLVAALADADALRAVPAAEMEQAAEQEAVLRGQLLQLEQFGGEVSCELEQLRQQAAAADHLQHIYEQAMDRVAALEMEVERAGHQDLHQQELIQLSLMNAIEQQQLVTGLHAVRRVVAGLTTVSTSSCVRCWWHHTRQAQMQIVAALSQQIITETRAKCGRAAARQLCRALLSQHCKCIQWRILQWRLSARSSGIMAGVTMERDMLHKTKDEMESLLVAALERHMADTAINILLSTAGGRIRTELRAHVHGWQRAADRAVRGDAWSDSELGRVREQMQHMEKHCWDYQAAACRAVAAAAEQEAVRWQVVAECEDQLQQAAEQEAVLRGQLAQLEQFGGEVSCELEQLRQQAAAADHLQHIYEQAMDRVAALEMEVERAGHQDLHQQELIQLSLMNAIEQQQLVTGLHAVRRVVAGLTTVSTSSCVRCWWHHTRQAQMQIVAALSQQIITETRAKCGRAAARQLCRALLSQHCKCIQWRILQWRLSARSSGIMAGVTMERDMLHKTKDEMESLLVAALERHMADTAINILLSTAGGWLRTELRAHVHSWRRAVDRAVRGNAWSGSELERVREQMQHMEKHCWDYQATACRAVAAAAEQEAVRWQVAAECEDRLQQAAEQEAVLRAQFMQLEQFGGEVSCEL